MWSPWNLVCSKCSASVTIQIIITINVITMGPRLKNGSDHVSEDLGNSQVTHYLPLRRNHREARRDRNCIWVSRIPVIVLCPMPTAWSAVGTEKNGFPRSKPWQCPSQLSPWQRTFWLSVLDHSSFLRKSTQVMGESPASLRTSNTVTATANALGCFLNAKQS